MQSLDVGHKEGKTEAGKEERNADEGRSCDLRIADKGDKSGRPLGT